jgi:hypothetical protein
VCRSNHSHIGLDSTVPTDPVEVPVTQNAQQAGLQLKRHVADFIQKQGAAISLLKAAPAHGLRTGEGAALMAKQLALQQILGNGRRVDGHKGTIGTR